MEHEGTTVHVMLPKDEGCEKRFVLYYKQHQISFST